MAWNVVALLIELRGSEVGESPHTWLSSTHAWLLLLETSKLVLLPEHSWLLLLLLLPKHAWLLLLTETRLLLLLTEHARLLLAWLHS